jgi:RNA polymerase sigma-70 factor (ECF subfamily)
MQNSLDTKNTITKSEFERLYLQYRPRFVTIATGYVRDRMVAEDIVTDCFMSYFENRDRLSAEIMPVMYIMTSVRNRCLNWLRDQSTHNRIEEHIQQTSQRSIKANLMSLEVCDPHKLFEDEVSEIVRREISAMPTITQRVLTGLRFEGRSYADIASELGISVRRVEYEVQKAMKKLRNALKDYLS